MGNGNSDEKQLFEIVKNIALFADQWKFDQARELFADELESDYRALGAEKIENISNTQLIENWQKILPGFEKTEHKISGLTAEIDGDTAWTYSTIIAYHYLKGVKGGDEWVVLGKYKHHFIKKDGVWKCDKMGLF